MQVIKNNGKLEPFQPAKIRQWVQWALEGQNDIKKQIEMEHYILSTTISRLPEQVKTSDIQDTMVRVCLDKEDIEYSRVAANIEKANILKNQSRLLGVFKPETTDFDEYLELFEEEGIWKGDWIQDVKTNTELVNDWYIELESRSLEYWTIKQWSDKYSLKRNKLAIETPALGCLAISIAYHGVTQLAFDFARDLLYYKTNLPTPALNGVRNGDFNSISCCVIEGGDSVESIGVAQHIAGEMTAKKAGIGITLDTRSTGDPVRGGRVEHLGKRPLYVAIEKEVKKFTQETRGGSATMTIKCIDPDIMGLLLLKTQKIDLSKRVDKIDYSFAYNDDFVKAILNDDDWYLFSKHLAPEVHDNFHKVDYMKYVKKAIRNKIPYTKVKALDILIKFIEARWETGRMYCINLTRVNLHTPFLDPIKQSNLCVAPETQILTDVGYVSISEVEGELVRVWNGQEYSEVKVTKTGENQPIVRVITDSGYELSCTPYHKFYVAEGYKGKEREVRAHELKPGDKLIKLDTKVVQGTSSLPLAYENGFFSADGCITKSGDRLYFYGDKINSVLPYIDTSTETSRYDQPEHNRTYIHLEGLKEKFFVPMSNYTVEARLKWLAGYVDGDGSIYRNGTNEQLVAASINKDFLLDIQLMLQTLGVQAKVTEVSGTKGTKLLPKNDGSGEMGEFECQQLYRLIITSCGLYKLSQLGFETNRLQWTPRKPQRDARRFVKIVDVVDEGRSDDTYCFNEPKRHKGVFNGLLTGQCMEINLPTKPFIDMKDLYGKDFIPDLPHFGEVAFCALAALNVANISFEEYFEVAERALRTVDKMIERAPAMCAALGFDLRRRRSVGIGITGLASLLYKEGLDYDGSPESIDFTEEVAELHYYALLKASQKLAKEDNFSVEGIDTNWLPIDTMISNREPLLDWELLRGNPRKHSVLVSHMPTESSAVFSSATNGLYPSRERVIYKAARLGRVQFISEYFDDTKLNAYDVPSMVPYYQAVANFTDQGISADYYEDFTKYPNKKVPMEKCIEWFLDQAMAGVKTAYYHNFKDGSADNKQEIVQEETCTDGGCKL